jgi:methyl-accepting chemotaxis protein
MLNAIGEISDSNQEIMDEMTKSNEEISKIVKVISDIGEKTKVINDIVFQTKLLSFNASVEAARAGEHGKGFAVVAEEVGNLASMSGKAAHEITEMLEGSIKQVTDIADVTKKNIDTLVEKGRETIETGKMTANECVGSLDEIMNNVKSVTEITQEIAGASAEQASGVKEITLAMQQLDEISHKNSTVAAESSNMAEELRTNAAVLEESISDLRAIVGGAEVKEKTVKSAPKTSKTKEVEARPKSKVNVISLTEKASNKAPEKVTDKPIVQKAKKESNPSAPIEEKVAVGQSFTPSKDDDRFEDF